MTLRSRYFPGIYERQCCPGWNEQTDGRFSHTPDPAVAVVCAAVFAEMGSMRFRCERLHVSLTGYLEIPDGGSRYYRFGIRVA